MYVWDVCMCLSMCVLIVSMSKCAYTFSACMLQNIFKEITIKSMQFSTTGYKCSIQQSSKVCSLCIAVDMADTGRPVV